MQLQVTLYPENEVSNSMKQIFGWCSFFLVWIGVLCLCIYISSQNENYAKMISIGGSVASLAGITVAVYQVWELQSRTKAVESALNDAKEKMTELTIFSDVNTHSQFIKEVQTHIRTNHHGEALITYKELKEKLCKLLGYIEGCPEFTDQYGILKKLVGNAGSDINNLNRLIMNSNSYADCEKMVENLEDIKTLLDNMIGKLSRGKL